MNHKHLLRIALTTILGATALSACTHSTPVGSSAAAGSETSSAGVSAPTGGASSATYVVKKRDLTVAYRFNGATQASAAISITAPASTSVKIAPALGTAITAGQKIGTITANPEAVASLNSAATKGTVAASRLLGLKGQARELIAPINGTITQNAGLTSINTPGIDAVVDLTPLQYLRYQAFRFTGLASVETVFGQQKVPCTSIWLSAAAILPPTASPGSGSDSMTGATSAGQLHCRLPADTETAPGLPLSLQLTAETIKNTIAVPSIYVGLDKLGQNYVVGVREPDGTVKDQPVTVGATDGVVRVIHSGLVGGETLQVREGNS